MSQREFFLCTRAEEHKKSKLTSDGTEGVEVLGGEQRSRELSDEFLEKCGGVVGTHFLPLDLT